MKFLILCLLLILKINICKPQGAASTTQTNNTGLPPKTPLPANTKVKPPSNIWVGNYAVNKENRRNLATWLLTGDYKKGYYTEKHNVEYEGYDGWYNNLARPDLGAIDRPLLRRWPAAYRDGSYEPAGWARENPFNLSDYLLAGDPGSQSRTGKNALLVFFGQQVVEEILDAQRPACPPEYFNIPIPKNHRLRNETEHTVMPLLRTRYDMRTGYSPNNPRQQLNEITPYLDGGLVYGTTKSWADFLRKYKNGSIDENGLLATEETGLFPEYNDERLPMANPPPPFYHKLQAERHELFPVSRFFKLGNPRGNENTFLLTFGVLWFRWHNYIAKEIKILNPKWKGEKIFNEARKWVIATQQRIVTEVWLKEWLGTDLDTYQGYDPSIDPQIDQFFQAAAMRFGHTLVVPGVYIRDYGRNGCNYKQKGWSQNAVRTCNAFWRPQEAIQAIYDNATKEVMDIDRILMGMAVQLCEEEDHKIVEDLRGNVFGPLEFSRRDLMAINIQRGRDHGLPDYNTARKAYNLPYINSTDDPIFADVHPNIKRKFMELYKNDWNNIDVWVGGILETRDNPGPLFQAIIKDQFRRIRDGDRFWFENKKNGLFTDAEIQRIKQIDVYDIIMAVTKMDHDDIPPNPFQVPTDNGMIHEQCRNKLVTRTCTKKKDNQSYQCFALPALNTTTLNENCTKASTYDYFYNSEISYILTFAFCGLFITLLSVVVWWYTLTQMNKKQASREQDYRQSFKETNNTLYPVKEWTGFKMAVNSIVIILDQEKKQIQVNTPRGNLLRAIDFNDRGSEASFDLFIASDGLHLMLNMKHEYSLVIQFDSEPLRENFLRSLETFTNVLNIKRTRTHLALNPMLKQAVTKADRQKLLEMFFRVVFAQAFNIQHSDDEVQKMDKKTAKEVINTELTVNEFAEALTMKSDSEFIRRIFSLIDKDRNGFVSFREFLDLLFIFAKGSGQDRAKLLFDMYDINKTGYLNEEDFKHMIQSLMETVHASAKSEDLQAIINNIKRDTNLNKNGMNFDDFYRIFHDDIEKIGHVNIGFKHDPSKSKRSSYLDEAMDTIENLYLDPRELQNRVGGGNAVNDTKLIDDEQDKVLPDVRLTKVTFWYGISRYIETNMREIFWVSLYTIVLLAIFAERAYYYSVEREHSGLRRIAGYGVTVTRGAASAMMFTYASLLVTMCRNTITILRETFLNNWIPFDRSVEMHKYISCWALVFTLMHIIGHAFNFYHISTQTADDLTCLFRNYFHATHELPKFHYWCWQTMTGFTGIVLTIIGALIYICAIPGVSRNLFWKGHVLYPFFFVFMILHGTGRLIQEPFFPNFLVGPLTIYVVDMLISASRKKVQIRVLNAELLPSLVTKLEFKRPNNFEYKSGQWLRIACLGLNPSEYHPFTISSSPNESTLTVHIRAVGPWTTAIRQLYDINSVQDKVSFPKIYLDGPYGEGHQDWYRYDVSVLVGGGIGVTPFASILKDIVFRANKEHKANCKKVYFIWITKTQRQFEWLVDIIREVELNDETKTVSIHLFVTQFYQKFDLRTTLLYICERHFQRISGKSLFTGLKAITHFGRPMFPQFFKSLQSLHPDVQSIGVFSCGPPPMTASVERACLQVNKSNTTKTTFHHHYKNF